jgi:hypothetical protein
MSAPSSSTCAQAKGGSTDRFSEGMRTMQKVVTVPLWDTSTDSSVGTAQRGHEPRAGTYTRLQLGQRWPRMRRLTIPSRKRREARPAA